MVFREGGAHGVHHTAQSVKFCRCNTCIKDSRNARLDPENAGKTMAQLMHEGKLGYVRHGVNIDKIWNPLPVMKTGLKNVLRMEASEVLKQHSEQEAATLEAAPGEPSPELAAPRPPATLADFVRPASLRASAPAAPVTLRLASARTLSPQLVPAPVVRAPAAWPAGSAAVRRASGPPAIQTVSTVPVVTSRAVLTRTRTAIAPDAALQPAGRVDALSVTAPASEGTAVILGSVELSQTHTAVPEGTVVQSKPHLIHMRPAVLSPAEAAVANSSKSLTRTRTAVLPEHATSPNARKCFTRTRTAMMTQPMEVAAEVKPAQRKFTRTRTAVMTESADAVAEPGAAKPQRHFARTRTAVMTEAPEAVSPNINSPGGNPRGTTTARPKLTTKRTAVLVEPQQEIAPGP